MGIRLLIGILGAGCVMFGATPRLALASPAYYELDDLGPLGGDVQFLETFFSTGVETRIQPTVYQPTETVLGAGYDPGTATFYVLDAAPTEGVAKLVAHDLISGKSTLLRSLTFADLYDYTSLDVADDGQLVMTVGTTTSFTSWRIDKDDGSFLGRIDGQGEMLRLPTMGWNFLSFPYLDNEGLLHIQRQAPWDFIGGPGCEGL